MNHLLKHSIIVFLATIVLACEKNERTVSRSEMTMQEKNELIEKIEILAEKDQYFRRPISLGTLSDSLLEIDAKNRNEMSVQEYLEWSTSVKSKLPAAVEDSLRSLQDSLDFENYQNIKSLIRKYGYPSKEFLNVPADKLFAILLHPPSTIDAEEYLTEMVDLLEPEVLNKNLEPISYARFYDNIKWKILGQPQLYGTNKSFNPETMSIGPARIEDIQKTNAARKRIGLPELKEGEYEILEN